MLIVDAHLDLAHNVARGRDVTRPASEQPVDRGCIATVGLPDLRAGDVKLICATIFTAPARDGKDGYKTPDEAHAMGLSQVRWYQRQFEAGQLALVKGNADLDGIEASKSDAIRTIILMESADPIRAPGEAAFWYDLGVRIVGMAWQRTRYAGGTGAPGPLAADGVALIRELDKIGMIHDASHLAEESFWQLLGQSGGPIIASHSNCRAIVPTDRQLTDDMIKALAKRGGVIGIVHYDKFLLPPDEYGKRRAALSDIVRHAKHMCDLIGDAKHVGIGTDMDGGLGRDQIPQELSTSADLPRVADVLTGAGFNDADVAGIVGMNWLRFFRKNLKA